MIITEEQKIESKAFYKEALTILNETGIDFMIGGAFAIFHYTGLYRDTKDLDVFCKAEDYQKILKHFSERQYRIEHTDARWLAKVFKNDYFIDIIFDSPNNICRVDDSWLQHAPIGSLEGIPVKILPAEELVWCKLYVQNRERYDGADVNHIFLKYDGAFNWERLFSKMNKHWHLLLAQLLSFQFVYPADYQRVVPKWLFDELIKRAQSQYELPPSVERICLGPVIDQTQYEADIKLWGYRSYTMKSV